MTGVAGLLRFLDRHLLGVAVLVAIIVATFLYVLPRAAVDRPASVQLTGSATPEAGFIVEINGDPVGRADFSSRVKTRTVPFEGQPIKTIDLVPKGPQGTRVNLNRVRIAYGSSVVSDYHDEQLGILQFSGLDKLRIDKSGVNAQLGRQEAQIRDEPQPPLVVPNKIGAAQRWLLGQSHSPLMPNIFVVALLLGLLAVLLPGTRKPWLAFGALVATWILAYLGYKVVPDIIDPAPPVAVAVGAASYFGNTYLGQQIAGFLIVAAIVGAALAIRFYFGNRFGKTPATVTQSRAVTAGDPAEDKPPRGTRRNVLIIVFAWLAMSLTIVPTLSAPDLSPVNVTWDAANGTVWNFFTQHGLFPMKDFWLPYGFQSFFGQVPLGPVWAWLAYSAMLGLLTWAMWRLSERSVWRTVASVVAVTLLAALGSGLWRYLPGLLMALTYAAVGPLQWQRLQWSHVTLFASTALALLIEPDLLLYGIAGCAFVVFGEVLFGRLRLQWSMLRRLATDLIPVMAALAFLALVWIVSGTFDGNIEYWTHLRDTAAYGSSDQSVDGLLFQISLKPTANSVVASIPFLVLLAGLALGFLGKERRSVGASRLLLATAGASLIFLGRGLIRPNDLLYYLPLVGLSLALILLWDRKHLASVVLTGAFVGATVAGLQYNGGLRAYLGGAANSPIRAVDSAIYVSNPDQAAYATDQVYALRRYEALPDIDFARELVQVSGTKHPPFAVLGDAAILYLWFNQKPPYHVNLYDAAPIRMQKKMIGELESRDTRYIVWKQEPVGVDGVPYQVRDALVYQYVIQHYGPSRAGWRKCPDLPARCTAADILVRLPSGKRPQIDFWRSRLGDQLDLGYIPSYAKSPTTCSGEGCVQYAIVRGKASKEGDQVELQASARGKRFNILLRARPDTSSYTIRLDRLWFWPMLGPHAQLTATSTDWTVERKQGKSDNRLY